MVYGSDAFQSKIEYALVNADKNSLFHFIINNIKSLPFHCIEYFSLIIYRTILC